MLRSRSLFYRLRVVFCRLWLNIKVGFKLLFYVQIFDNTPPSSLEKKFFFKDLCFVIWLGGTVINIGTKEENAFFFIQIGDWAGARPSNQNVRLWLHLLMCLLLFLLPLLWVWKLVLLQKTNYMKFMSSLFINNGIFEDMAEDFFWPKTWNCELQYMIYIYLY